MLFHIDFSRGISIHTSHTENDRFNRLNPGHKSISIHALAADPRARGRCAYCGPHMLYSIRKHPLFLLAHIASHGFLSYALSYHIRKERGNILFQPGSCPRGRASRETGIRKPRPRRSAVFIVFCHILWYILFCKVLSRRWAVAPPFPEGIVSFPLHERG